MKALKNYSIGIYVRISRDDNGENYETVENQKGLLLNYVEKHGLGRVYDIYIDDNVSGSGFERKGLARLKKDVLDGKINLLLVKDLSRLGRNNAKTLQWIDFLEEYGVRILTGDGRYDSLLDNDMAGIETWINERYIRDISRKIRSCLRYKIQKGEYLGNAPFGYKKSDTERNKLVVDAAEAEVVRLIYKLYRFGLGYTSIANKLNETCRLSPKGVGWNRITVRRILCSRVYIGDTVQGVSEKISFKSKKTRRLPEEEWVITEGTHEGIISREEFMEVQRIRAAKISGKRPCRYAGHALGGIMRCGGCGSVMYARRRAAGIAYVCGNYCRNGRASCSSHFAYEDGIVRYICGELAKIFEGDRFMAELEKMVELSSAGGRNARAAVEGIRKQAEAVRRQQETLYKDRLEGRISTQLFERMNRRLEERSLALAREQERLGNAVSAKPDCNMLVKEARSRISKRELSNELIRLAVSRITVYDGREFGGGPGPSGGAGSPGGGPGSSGRAEPSGGEGVIVIDFRFGKRL